MSAPPLPAGLRTRIAPTPSGLLHAGNGAAFLLTAGLARQAGGTLALRIDDLDQERVRPAYIEDIFVTLEWLGIRWSEGPRNAVEQEQRYGQEMRIARYLDLVEALRRQDLLYACTCSRTTVALCTCREADHPFEGPDRAWRLRVPHEAVVTIPSWPGAARAVRLHEALPDPVLRQRNGRPAYQVASLADDVDQGMTFIVRGEDLLPSTACQLFLAERLGLASFLDVRFVHHGLLRGPDGAKRSKSQGAGSLQAFRAAGGRPTDIQAMADALLAELLADQLR